MADTAGPSNEQNDLLNQFMEVCDVDENVARTFLNRTRWDIETAIQQFFHSNDPEAIQNFDNEVQEFRRRRRSINEEPIPTLQIPSRSTTDAIQLDNSWTGFFRNLIYFPIRWTFVSIGKVLHFIYLLLFNPQNRLTAYPDRTQERARELEQEELLRNRQLMHQQNAEYAQALAADQARREEQARLEQQRIQEELRLRTEQEKLERKKQRLVDLRSEIRKSLESQKIPSSNDENIVRVRIKFPSGYVLVRNFFTNDSLEMLFNVVFSNEQAPEDFSLIGAYPPQVLRCEPEWYREFGSEVLPIEKIPTFEEAGLTNSILVHIRDNLA